MWRGQTIESEAWNSIKEYDRQHGVTESLVPGRRGLAALLDPDRRQRDGGPGREPVGQPHAHADVPGTRLAGAPGLRELVGAGGRRCAPTPRRSARARPALLRLAVGAEGHGREGNRRGRRHAHRLAPDGGGLRAAPRIRRRLHRRGSFPAPAGPDPATVGGAAGNTRGRRASCAAPTGARPRRRMAAGRRGCGTGHGTRARRARARSRRGPCANGSRRRPSRS